jgi:hypothetical protein
VPASGAAACQHFAPVFATHARTEAMLVRALSSGWLKCSFHRCISLEIPFVGTCSAKRVANLGLFFFFRKSVAILLKKRRPMTPKMYDLYDPDNQLHATP